MGGSTGLTPLRQSRMLTPVSAEATRHRRGIGVTLLAVLLPLILTLHGRVVGG